MVIDRRHLNILEVISVILFSVFGSYLVAVDPAFNQNVSVGEVIRLISVLASGVCLYFAVFRMKKIDEEACVDFHSETDLIKKAESSIDDRYMAYFLLERSQILFRVIFSIGFLALFVALEFLPPSYTALLDHTLFAEQLPSGEASDEQGHGLQEDTSITEIAE